MVKSFLPTQFPDLVGFDRIFDLMERQVNRDRASLFPPYDVVQERNQNNYRIDLAVAGFLQKDINITFHEGVLTIQGKRDNSLKSTLDQKKQERRLHQGIRARDFEQKFTLADSIKVKGAELTDGILSVYLENVVPEEDQPQQIPIGSGVTQGSEQLLTE